MSSSECYPEKAPRIDDLLEVLGHRLRREVVHYFENHTDEQTVPLEELVTHVEDRVPGEGGDDLRTRFVHVHLPKLADYGWVDYDARDQYVRYRGHEQAAQWLAELQDVFAE